MEIFQIFTQYNLIDYVFVYKHKRTTSPWEMEKNAVDCFQTRVTYADSVNMFTIACVSDQIFFVNKCDDLPVWFSERIFR